MKLVNLMAATDAAIMFVVAAVLYLLLGIPGLLGLLGWSAYGVYRAKRQLREEMDFLRRVRERSAFYQAKPVYKELRHDK